MVDPTSREKAHADLKRRFQAALHEKQKLHAQNKIKPTYTTDELIKAIEWVNSLT